MSTQRRNLALFALALGGFGLGLAEFATFGLLPEIARDVVPGSISHARALSHAGWGISSYALGVVVGAPTVAVLTARTPKLKVLAWLFVALAVGNAASAFASSLPLLLVARFVAGLPHGAYFGVAGLLAANTIGPDARGRGFAVVLSGLTISNVIGVPLVTRLGQAAGWRAAYVVVAVVFLLALLLSRVSVRDTGSSTGSARGELSALRSGAVWLAVGVAAIGFAGFFTVDSYLAPIATHSAHLSERAVPWVLAVVGLGMTLGTVLGGASADRHPTGSLFAGLAALAGTLVAFALLAQYPVGLFVTAFAVGAAAVFLAPALQAQLIGAAPTAVLIGPALNQSATNVANSAGALAGGAVLANDLPYTATGWVGAGLAVVGLVIAGAALLRSGRLTGRSATR